MQNFRGRKKWYFGLLRLLDRGERPDAGIVTCSRFSESEHVSTRTLV